jgi:hypothetical protein
MKSYKGAIGLSLILTAMAAIGLPASAAQLKAKTAVLVHGAFADGSSWEKVIPDLEKAGLKVIAVQNPLLVEGIEEGSSLTAGVDLRCSTRSKLAAASMVTASPTPASTQRAVERRRTRGTGATRPSIVR